MEKIINWINFSDEMPKEDQWYLVAMKDSIPLVGYIHIENKNNEKLYSFEYYRCSIKATVYFDEKNHDGLFAWTLAKDLY